MIPHQPRPWTRPEDPGVDREASCHDGDDALIVIFSLSCLLQAPLVALALWVLR